MGKIGKGLVKKQGATRDSGNFISPDKVLDIKKQGGEWARFKAEETHRINIIPWKITSKKDIAFRTKGEFHKELGEYVYSLNYFCHPRIHDEKDVLCIKKHFNQECAICDAAQKKWDIYNNEGKTDDQKKAAGALSAKMRSMYNIELITDKGRGKNAFMESSDFIFEDELLKAALDCEDGEEPVAFYETDTEEGRIVRFKRPKSPMKPSEGFKFLERKKAISEKLLAGVLKFGELIEVPTPEEVKDFFYGNSFEEDSENDDYEEAETEVIEDEVEEGEEESYEEEADDDVKEIAEEDDGVEEYIDSEKSNDSGKPDSCPSKKKFGIEFGDFDKCDDCKAEMACHKASKKNK